MRKHICERCGKTIYYYHIANGKIVCPDDRLCYEKKIEKRRIIKTLERNKIKRGCVL